VVDEASAPEAELETPDVALDASPPPGEPPPPPCGPNLDPKDTGSGVVEPGAVLVVRAVTGIRNGSSRPPARPGCGSAEAPVKFPSPDPLDVVAIGLAVVDSAASRGHAITWFAPLTPKRVDSWVFVSPVDLSVVPLVLLTIPVTAWSGSGRMPPFVAPARIPSMFPG
jgi:hypothetical protein